VDRDPLPPSEHGTCKTVNGTYKTVKRTMARVMLTEQENKWIATPFRASADPLPQTVTSPSAKSCPGKCEGSRARDRLST